MNLVGMQGKGESVWLGFFLCEVLRQFIEVARARGRLRLRRTLPRGGGSPARSLEQHGWDGEWYRRAYFDDGTPPGSAASGMPYRLDLAELGRPVRGPAMRYVRARP